MKKTLLFMLLGLAVSAASAQPASPSSRHGRHNLDMPALKAVGGSMSANQSKDGYLYKINEFYSGDDYERTVYSYTPSNRCNAIYAAERYAWELYDSIYYDAYGRIDRIDGYQLLQGQWTKVYYTIYTYNDRGLVDTRTNYNLLGGEFCLGGVYYYTYNDRGQITLSQLYFMDRWFDKTEYLYDGDGRLSRIQYYESDAFDFEHPLRMFETWTYSYTPEGRMSRGNDSVWDEDTHRWLYNGCEEYLYDAAGNCSEYHTLDMNNNYTKRCIYTYEDRLLSETLIPHTPEHETPYTYTNHNTYSMEEYWVLDADHVLQHMCDYYYDYCGANAIEVPTVAEAGVYPNPVAEVLHVEGCEGDHLIEIFDMQGRCVRMQRLSGGDHRVDVASLAPGSYILRVEGANTRTARFVVTR